MLLRSRSTRPALRTTAAGIAALTLVAVLTACSAGGVEPTPSARSTDAPTPSSTPEAEPVEEPAAPAVESAELLRANVRDGISSGNTEALEGSFTDPVRVVIASSEADSQLAPLDAVLALDYIQPGVGTWEWELTEAEIDGYRASVYYGALFPEDVIVGRSSEGPVVAFSPAGATIHTILMAIDEDLLFY
jgi:hypothetical protein